MHSMVGLPTNHHCLSATCALCPAFQASQVAFLGSLSQLQHLCPFNVNLHGGNLPPAVAPAPGQHSPAGSLLLTVLGQLTQLTYLHLGQLPGLWAADVWREPLTAITSSSRLHTLVLGKDSWFEDGEAGLLPERAQLFRSALPQLEVLPLREAVTNLQDTQVEAMVACCPSIQGLHLNVKSGTQPLRSGLAPLTALQALTSLSLTCHHRQAEVFSAVRELVGLRRLSVYSDTHKTDRHLLQLTALRQLTYLHVDGCGTHLERFASRNELAPGLTLRPVSAVQASKGLQHGVSPVHVTHLCRG